MSGCSSNAFSKLPSAAAFSPKASRQTPRLWCALGSNGLEREAVSGRQSRIANQAQCTEVPKNKAGGDQFPSGDSCQGEPTTYYVCMLQSCTFIRPGPVMKCRFDMPLKSPSSAGARLLPVPVYTASTGTIPGGPGIMPVWGVYGSVNNAGF